MHDRTPRTSLTCLNRPTDITVMQAIFAVHFTSGSFPHLGRPLDTSSGISYRYSSATSICLTISSHYRYNPMSDFEFFLKDPGQWGEAHTSIWGHLDLCPILVQFHLASITHSELSLLTSLRAWGETEKFCSGITYLLISTEDGVASDRVYGLSIVWVNLYQARISTIEEVVRQLTTLVSSGPHWHYGLVQLNGDTHHSPLPREEHLCILTEGGNNSASCRHVRQLEVHQFLCSDSKVIYPIGLNGCKAPVTASPPESLARGANLLGSKPIYLMVVISQSMQRGLN